MKDPCVRKNRSGERSTWKTGSPFSKKRERGESAFAEERPILAPLPPKPFELSTWKIATVQLNNSGLLKLNKMYYGDAKKPAHLERSVSRDTEQYRKPLASTKNIMVFPSFPGPVIFFV
jgi:hypothetical protein